MDPRPELRRLAGELRSHLGAWDRLLIDRAGERVDRRIAPDAALVDRDVRARVEPEARSQGASGQRPEVDVARRHDALHVRRRARLHDGAGGDPRLAEDQLRLRLRRAAARRAPRHEARAARGSRARSTTKLACAPVGSRASMRASTRRSFSRASAVAGIPSDLSVERRLDVDALPVLARHREPPADRPLRVDSTGQPARRPDERDRARPARSTDRRALAPRGRRARHRPAALPRKGSHAPTHARDGSAAPRRERPVPAARSAPVARMAVGERRRSRAGAVRSGRRRGSRRRSRPTPTARRSRSAPAKTAPSGARRSIGSGPPTPSTWSTWTPSGSRTRTRTPSTPRSPSRRDVLDPTVPASALARTPFT